MLNMVIFSFFTFLLLFAAIMAVFSTQALHSVLWLALTFFVAAGFWVGLEAEFLGIVLVLVYVGAVMTLFLFVVMTLPSHTINQTHQKRV